MYEQETIKPYDGEGEKGKLVETMFDNIAPTYDTLNHRLSWDIDKYWRKKAVKALVPYSPKKILDIATGTGDFAILQAQMLHPETLIGVDISEGMMQVGREKVARLGLSDIISFAKEDCLNLSFDSNSFDAVTAAFGIRNFQDLECGLREMYRVLREGGLYIAVRFCHSTADLFRTTQMPTPISTKLLRHSHRERRWWRYLGG